MESKSDVMEHSLVMPYLTGVYLAVNAIRDAYLVVDGPNCVFFKTSQIQGNHDWHSTLVSCTGLHRVADTDGTTERAAMGDNRLLLSRLQQVDAIPDCSLILLTSMSPIAITGRQYDKILGELKGRLTKPVIQIRCGSLTGDWLHGYWSALEALARQLDEATTGDLHDDEVAIVGYLMDRNEADHTANVAEMNRLIEGMALKMTSAWLSGGRVLDLFGAFQAKTIVSFPHGRQAARIIASRTGARLLECDLPIGLKATCKWLRKLGKATGRSEEAEVIIERELSNAVPKLKWILPHSLLNRNIVLMGSDPFLLEAVRGAVEELGCRVPLTACFSHESHAVPSQSEDAWQVNPEENELRQRLQQLNIEQGLHLFITNSRAISFKGVLPAVPAVELGFPSYYTHALTDNPYLGFTGLLKLVERMTNKIGQASI